ncbi:MAG: SBBP repeat-containing protein [Bacteroidetes bacterium]|nr:SBBP repeat-containing protein [Bacteroidota bacterium]
MKYLITILFLLLFAIKIELNAQGTPVWFNSAGSASSEDDGKAIAVDSLGNSYIIGSFTGSIKLGSTVLTSKGAKDILVASYSPDGILVWAKNFGGLGDEVPKSMVCDAGGTLSICGTFIGNVDLGGGLLKSSGAVDGFVLRLTSTGSFVWATRIGGPSDDVANAISIDEKGNCYVTGSFSDTLGFNGGKVPTLVSPGGTDIYVLKLSTNGVVQWAKRAGGISYDEGLSIVYDSHGFITLAGSFWGKIEFPGGTATDLTSVGNYDIFISQYSVDGVPRWSQRVGGGNEDSPRGLAVDDSGTVYLTGTYTGQAGFSGSTYTLRDGGMFLARYSPDGFPDWVRRVGNNQSDIGNAIALDGNGNVYLIGNFYETTNFKLSNVPDITSAGKSDVIIACFNTIGSIQWALRAGGAENDNGNSITVNDKGDLFVTGNYRATAEFPGGSLSNSTSTGGSDIFVLRYNIPKFTIIGLITLNGQPFEDVSVTDGTRTSQTGTNGLYELKNVPNGTYVVTPTKESYQFLPVSTEVKVKGITPPGVNFAARFVLLPPVLEYPNDNQTKVSTTISLKWKATIGAKIYHVQISTLPLFPDFILDDSTLSSLSVSTSNLKVATQYYWQVRASDGISWSDWSEIRSFVTADALPGQVLLSTPQNQSKEQSVDQLFTWKILPNSAFYHFQLSKSSDFSVLISDDSALNVILKKVDGLEYNSRYYWRVQGNIEGVWGQWSDVWNFQTKVSDGVEDFTSNQKLKEILIVPSPVLNRDYVTILYPETYNCTITISSILGVKMKEFSTKGTNGNFELDISNWFPGMYTANYIESRKVKSAPFIIVR